VLPEFERAVASASRASEKLANSAPLHRPLFLDYTLRNPQLLRVVAVHSRAPRRNTSGK
jgi:hypothetical protein